MISESLGKSITLRLRKSARRCQQRRPGLGVRRQRKPALVGEAPRCRPSPAGRCELLNGDLIGRVPAGAECTPGRADGRPVRVGVPGPAGPSREGPGMVEPMRSGQGDQPSAEPGEPGRSVGSGARGWLSRNLVILTLVSLLQDAASELVYPLMPLLITGVLAAPPVVLGVIEGLAEATAGLTRYLTGRWSDRSGRKAFIGVGYGLAAVGKVLVAAATSWPLVLGGRVVDRLGKGVRSAPRDALIAASVPPAALGRAFGFHRAGDSLGTVIGPLLGLLAFAVAYLGPGLIGAGQDPPQHLAGHLDDHRTSWRGPRAAEVQRLLGAVQALLGSTHQHRQLRLIMRRADVLQNPAPAIEFLHDLDRSRPRRCFHLPHKRANPSTLQTTA